MMRRVAAVLIATAFVTVASPRPAAACSCVVPDLESSVDRAAAAFVGRQVDQVDDGGRVTLIVEVVESYKGDLGDVVELHTSASPASCGISFANAGEVGITAWEGPDGLAVGLCSSAWDAEEMRLHFNGLPDTTGEAIDFYVGTSGSEAEIAALDAQGRPVAWGLGSGMTTALAVCPGGDVIATVVESGERWAELTEPVVIRLRDARTLEPLGDRSFTVSARSREYTNGQWWLDDLECHDAAGSRISYLTRSYVYDDYAAAFLLSSGRAHVWRGTDQFIHALGDTRAIAVDWSASVIYGISGADGETLDRWDVMTGELLASDPLPGGASAWDVDLVDGILAIAARHAPADMINRWFEEVDQLMLVGTADDWVTVAPMAAPGQLVGLQATPDGATIVAMAMMRDDVAQPATTVSRFGPDGSLIETNALGYVDVSFRSAVGSSSVALTAWGRHLVLDDGQESEQVSGILNPLAVIAAPSTAPVSEPIAEPTVASTTAAVPAPGATTVPTETMPTSAIGAGDDAPVTDLANNTQADPARASPGLRWPLLGGAIGVIAFLIVRPYLTRRRDQ